MPSCYFLGVIFTAAVLVYFSSSAVKSCFFEPTFEISRRFVKLMHCDIVPFLNSFQLQNRKAPLDLFIFN